MGTQAERGERRGPVPRLHTAFEGTPYFDEDLEVGQSRAHSIMTSESAPILRSIADEAGILFLSDEPIWYLHPESDEQKAYYGDLVLARAVDRMRITSSDLLLVIEVVSTNDRRKELKDTRFQRLLNEYNAVPEFALVFPELDDPRALTWLTMVDGEYREQVIAPGASVCSHAVAGLELRVRPRDDWAPGYKLDVYFRDELRPRLPEERARAEQETARAEQEAARAQRETARAERETARAEQETARAEREKARADALEARLRELGGDPDA